MLGSNVTRRPAVPGVERGQLHRVVLPQHAGAAVHRGAAAVLALALRYVGLAAPPSACGVVLVVCLSDSREHLSYPHLSRLLLWGCSCCCLTDFRDNIWALSVFLTGTAKVASICAMRSN